MSTKGKIIEKCIKVRNIANEINACLDDEITITKVIVGLESTRLEMTPASITKIRNAIEKQRHHVNGSENCITTHDQVVINGGIYYVLETKRDFGLFAGGNTNYIVVNGVHPHFKKGEYQLYGEHRNANPFA